MESTELAADESALTGESVPAKKDSDFIIEVANTPVAERHNMLYSGTYITSGFGKMVVTAVGDKTEFGKIAQELAVTDKTTTPLQERLGRLGKTITVFGVIAATIVFITQLISYVRGSHGSVRHNCSRRTGGIAYYCGSIALHKHYQAVKQNALVKKIIASETVGCINVICPIRQELSPKIK